MADYYDQARAIWSALDSMLDKDPEEYRKFVTEQLKDGQKMMKKQQQNSTKDADELRRAFESMSLNDPDTATTSVTNKKSNCSTLRSTAVKTKDTAKPTKQRVFEHKGHEEDETDTKFSLLDDDIGKSILAQIVKPDGLACQDGSGDLVDVNMMHIDTRNSYSKTKPMIEEL